MLHTLAIDSRLNMPGALATRPPQAPRPTHRIAAAVFLTTLALGIALPVGLQVWQAYTPTVVVASDNAGAFLSATSSSACFSPTLTNVQTTRGTLVVSGVFAALRGQALEVAHLNTGGGTQLCATGQLATCLPLAATWTGTFVRNPHPDAFDFTHYGLGSGHLSLWTLWGFLASALAGIGWLVAAHSEPAALEGPDL